MDGICFTHPYFENDEGTYFAQAWSSFEPGKLAPILIGMTMSVYWMFTSI